MGEVGRGHPGRFFTELKKHNKMIYECPRTWGQSVVKNDERLGGQEGCLGDGAADAAGASPKSPWPRQFRSLPGRTRAPPASALGPRAPRMRTASLPGGPALSRWSPRRRPQALRGPVPATSCSSKPCRDSRARPLAWNPWPELPQEQADHPVVRLGPSVFTFLLCEPCAGIRRTLLAHALSYNKVNKSPKTRVTRERLW